MSPLFRPISYYKGVPPFSFPLTGFSTAAAPPGTWPAAGGGAGRTGRGGEPLVHDRFTVAWQAPLGAATRPDGVLVAGDRIVVNGLRQRGFWSDTGAGLGFVDREPGASLIDVEGRRLLTNDKTAGVAVFSLDARQEASFVVAAPAEGQAREFLPGPGQALVLVTTHQPPHGAIKTVVETVRIRDYADRKRGTLYGIEPLGGLACEEEAAVVAAASARGPVLVTPSGLSRRDWQLGELHEVPLAARPIALAVDEREHAVLLSDDGGWPHLQAFPPSGEALFDLELSPDDAPSKGPLLVAPSGQIYLVSAGALLAVSPEGKLLWRQQGVLPSHATLTGNGLLLVGAASLDAVTSDGRHIPLWQPPSPVVAPPVLANECMYVATEDTLYVLRPDVGR